MMQETPKISVRSIAQHLGLSPATVSLVLNGRRPTSFVSVATRKQVWAAAKELGYPMERLRSTRPLLERVSVFVHAGPNPVYSETVLEICRVLNTHQVQVFIRTVRSDQEATTAAREMYARQEIDAAIFVGSRQEITPLDAPSVFVGEVPPDAHVWQVRADNEGGGRSVGEYLWSLGHRSIGAIVPGRVNLAGERRLAGLRACWEEHGKVIPEDNVLRCDPNETSDATLDGKFSEFLIRNRSSDHPVTAFFCFNDWVAGSALKILRGQGVKVPEEISVVGFDDSIYTELLDPPLTTVHNSFDALGAAGANLLLEMAGNPTTEPRVVVVPCRLVCRQSCLPPIS
ncbi:MAG: LacI family transcriptional regulator [Capsulimonas sp.]|jgi:DNA-binding LacI/PurR family transcriptional regulator|nr:LacI family transcriptional regulator [Capsulimonas sp.]